MKHQNTWVCIGLIPLLSGAIASAATETPAFKVDRSFGQEEFKGSPRKVSVDEAGKVYVLTSDGLVTVFDSEGKKVGGFDPGLQPPAGAMAIGKGIIHLLVTSTEEVEVESQGRKLKRQMPSGVKCVTFTTTGEKKSEADLPEMMSATDAHMVADALAVADYRQGQLVTFDMSGAEPKKLKKIDEGFRLCCGIFNFYPAADGKSLVVANLGAFKVQTYMNGRKTHEFGARGEKADEFHGCCNPVNVGDLGDDILVTVEKDTTRVRVCGRNGKDAKEIEGLGELVSGCSTIPIAVHGKDTFYLASAGRRCIVKCVSGSGASAGGPATSASASGGAYESRTWKDASGRSITGKLVAYEGGGTASPVLVRDGRIRLQMGTKTYDLPLARLSPSDREYVEKLQGGE
jgi:hypothetical protein